MKFNLSVSGLDQVKKDLNKYSSVKTKAIQKEVARTATTIQADAMKDAPVDTGVLRSSIRFMVGVLNAIVWAGAKYAEKVERGQRPGTVVPPEQLEGWVRRKLKVGAKRAKGVAYLVSRKIYAKGTKAQPFFAPAVDKQKDFAARIARIMK